MNNKSIIPIRILIGLIAIIVIAYNVYDQTYTTDTAQVNTNAPSTSVNADVQTFKQDDTQKITTSFEQQLNDVQVRASGKVLKVLPDDNKGSRHQRFILELQNQHTILIAHNIDLAPRIDNLKEGDFVEFYGVYEYNPQGGVVHWTHHDPKGQHIGGWLKHQNQTYE